VNVDSDFFRCGGDSLLVTVLESEIECRIGCSIPVGTIYRFSTPRTLGQCLQEGASLFENVTLGPESMFGHGRGSPVFYMPEITGYGHMPKMMAQRLTGQRPFFDRLMIRPITHDSVADFTIEKIASQLLPQIRRVRPHGPYVFMGYSFGGYLAFEVARQMASSGEQVDHVVIWDSVPDTSESQRSTLDRLIFLARKLSFPATWRDHRWIRDRVQYVINYLRTLPVQKSQRLGDGAGKASFANVVLSEHVVRRYRPQPYDGHVTLLYCTASGDSIRSKPVQPYVGWAAAVPRENLRILEFDCHHSDVLSSPQLDAFVEATRRVLEQIPHGGAAAV
jgi:thioesterase domain-containing protein